MKTIRRIVHDLILLALVSVLIIVGEFLFTTINRRINDHV